MNPTPAGNLQAVFFEGDKTQIAEDVDSWLASHPAAIVLDQNYNFQSAEIKKTGEVIVPAQHGLVLFVLE